MIWTHTVDNLQTFISYLNNLHPTTSSHSSTSKPFSDNGFPQCWYTYHIPLHQTHRQTPVPLTIFIPTLTHQLRLRRICSSDDTFNLRSNELNMQYFNKRGYNLSFLKQEIRRVRAIQRNPALRPNLKHIESCPFCCLL